MTAKGYISPSKIPYLIIIRIYRGGEGGEEGGGCEFVHTLLPFLNISKENEKTDTILIIHINSSTLTKKLLKTIIL